MDIIGVVVLWIGVFFCVVGIIGLLRFPDVYTRIHASGKVATLGLVGLLIGATILMPELFFRALVLIAFVILTAPVASHVIASAAHRSYGRLKVGTRDDLADVEEGIIKRRKTVKQNYIRRRQHKTIRR
jgi:multicomponent Na+:H+ antiporter subunit G